MTTIRFLKRPGLNQFIKQMSSLFDEIVIFTASNREYADAVIDSLKEVKHLIHHRLYWEHVSIIDKTARASRLTTQSVTTNTDMNENLSEGGPGAF